MKKYTINKINNVPADETGNASIVTGNANLTKADLGLGNVDNTSDLQKPVSTATQEALNLKANDADVLHKNGDEEKWGSLSFISAFDEGVVGFNDAIQVSTGLNNGPPTIQFRVTKLGGIFAKFLEVIGNITASPATLPNQVVVKSQLDAKQDALTLKTIKGQSIVGTGNIDLTKSDVGLANVDNTSDINKPVSVATQTALNLKANDAEVLHTTGNETKNGNLTINGTITASPATLQNQVVVKSQLDAKQSGFPKYPANFNKVAAVGTSITLGTGASTGNKWIDVFTATLNSVLARSITVINGGVSGVTSSQMLTNLPNIISQTPQIILLEASINDANLAGNGGLTRAQSETNYRNMITQCRNANIVPVLFSCWPLDIDKFFQVWGVTITTSQSKRTDLCNVLRKLSTELNVQLIDLDLVCAQNLLLMQDGVHPNDRGHLFGANVISGEVIKQAMIQ